MAKRGAKRHLKRLNQPDVFQFSDKKAFTFLAKPSPGPHPKDGAVALYVFLRNVLGIARNAREAKKLIKRGAVVVDGKVRRDTHFPVGLADVIAFPEIETAYVLLINKKGLTPFTIPYSSEVKKYEKVVKKYVRKGGELVCTTHDGHIFPISNDVKVGDVLVVDLGAKRVEKVLPLKEGAKCLIIKGKHRGVVAQLKELVSIANRRKEAHLETKEGEHIITLADYLFVIDDELEGVMNGQSHETD